MRDPRDYKLDITGVGDAPAGDGAGSAETGGDGTGGKGSADRPYIGVKFACCGVYLRVYRNADGTEYAGRCPRCGKQARFTIGPGGTDERQFTVY